MNCIVHWLRGIYKLLAPTGSTARNSLLRWSAIIPLTALSIVFALAQKRAEIPRVGLQAIHHANRIVLGQNIAHYTYDVRTGPGKFDFIRMHRIVKEVRPFRPAHTSSGLFMMPGAPNYFAAIYIPSTVSQSVPWDQSLAVYLAKNGIDVWGMDFGWALVPAETEAFTFFKDWGMERDARDAEIGISLARLIRGISGQGIGPLQVLGFSYGGMIAYTLAGEETQEPRVLHNVKGMVIFDIGMQLQDQADRDFYCSAAGSDQANLDAGVFSDDSGLLLKLISDLALNAPDDSSGIIPGLTNFQAALFFGTSTELMSGQSWHFVAGDLDENGIPKRLRYTENRLWLDVMGNIPPHNPIRSTLDGDAMFCGNSPSPFVEHLGQISLPILHIAAAGGFGEKGFYTDTLTSSADITKVLVKLQSDDMRQQDFGHADTVLANNAGSLIWERVLDWIRDHR